MRHTRNTAGIPYSSGGRFGAFTMLVAAIVMLVLIAGYSASNTSASSRDPDVARLAPRDRLVAAQGGPGVSAAAVRRARAHAVAMRRARIAVRRAAARRAAARRAVLRARRRASVRVTVIRRTVPVYSGVGQNLCAPPGSRGGSRAHRQARRQRALQRRQALYNLNLRC